MANKNIFEDLTRYRVKVDRDGKTVVDIPGIICLPGLIAAPRWSIAGIIAAPLLGYNVRLENESGETVNVEDTVRKAAEAVRESAATMAKAVREEMDKAWEEISAEDQEAEDEAKENTGDNAGENAEPQAAGDTTNQDIVEDLKAHEENDVPTIEVETDDDSARD